MWNIRPQLLSAIILFVRHTNVNMSAVVDKQHKATLATKCWHEIRQRQHISGVCADRRGRSAWFAPCSTVSLYGSAISPSKCWLPSRLSAFSWVFIKVVHVAWVSQVQVLPSKCVFYLTRWYVSQNMKTGCAAAIAMVRYILSWFLVPCTNLPSAAASDSNFRRRVRICGWRQQNSHSIKILFKKKKEMLWFFPSPTVSTMITN